MLSVTKVGSRRPAGEGDLRGRSSHPLETSQPLPRVEAALDFAGLLVPLLASLLPALESAALEGFAIYLTSSHVRTSKPRPSDIRSGLWQQSSMEVGPGRWTLGDWARPGVQKSRTLRSSHRPHTHEIKVRRQRDRRVACCEGACSRRAERRIDHRAWTPVVQPSSEDVRRGYIWRTRGATGTARPAPLGPHPPRRSRREPAAVHG